MGRSLEEDAVAIKLIAICSELNFILQKKCVVASQCFILLLEDDVDEELFVQSLVEKISAVEMINLKKESKIRNYQLAVLLFSKQEKEDKFNCFIKNKKFAKAIVIKGILPESLSGRRYVVRVSREMAFSVMQAAWGEEVQAVCKFARKNPELIIQELDLLKTSIIFLDGKLDSSLGKSLMAAARVFLLYFRSTSTEAETAEKQKCVYAEIERCMREADVFANEYDAIDGIKTTVVHYFDSSEEYIIADIEQVDGETMKAIKVAGAVLYDKKYYYIPEPLFRKACGMLLDTMPLIKIKQILREEEIITCNQTGKDSFTVKKVFTNVYGISYRERFLKFERDFFTSHEGLSWEDRRRGKENGSISGTNHGKYLPG